MTCWHTWTETKTEHKCLNILQNRPSECLSNVTILNQVGVLLLVLWEMEHKMHPIVNLQKNLRMFVSENGVSHHFSPSRNLHSKHTHASAAHTVLALFIVDVHRHLLIGLLQREWWIPRIQQGKSVKRNYSSNHFIIINVQQWFI